ncbi:MAG: SDR family oxidoreductase [Methylacidiphilales bacterium]|nr:SDR family oxidoreductase [Candidatus Methylacidiphilales bacterium]
MEQEFQLTNQYPSLKGKKVFITGGGTGIGSYLSEHFCAQGSLVSFIGVSKEVGTAHAKKLSSTYNTYCSFAPCDVRNIEQLQSSLEVATKLMGGLDIIINNSGNDERHTIEEVTPDYWDNCLNINLRPHFFTMQKALSLFPEQGGVIINMGSIGWMRGRTGIVCYTTSKGAIHALTRTMARELGVKNIRVNSVVPGAIVTPKQKALWLTPELDKMFIDLQCLKFRLTPNDVAALTLFLTSDDARAIAGQSYVVDGGIV